MRAAPSLSKASSRTSAPRRQQKHPSLHLQSRSAKITTKRPSIATRISLDIEGERRSAAEEPVAFFERSSEHVLCVAKALYDYDAAEVDELGFLAGDQINVIMNFILMKLSPFGGFLHFYT